jgi:transposase
MKTKNNKSGKPADVSGINQQMLSDWIHKDNVRWTAVKCQALIALKNGTSVTVVCEIFDVTRESLRLWRDRLKEEGIDGLANRKKGKKSNLTIDVKKCLQKAINIKPTELGYAEKNWTGKLVCRYLKEHQEIEISVRTAQNWLTKTGIRKIKRQKL